MQPDQNRTKGGHELTAKVPSVTVCLPVYNGAKYLAKAIESVRAQTYQDFELLIANDCSTDDSKAIMESFAQKDERIKVWTNAKNLGHYPNYNACLTKASGHFIKLFAQDDVFEPHMLERMVSVLTKNENVSVVMCARSWMDADEMPIKAQTDLEIRMTRPFVSDKLIPGEEAIVSTLREQINWLGEPVCQMFRRQFTAAGFDEAFHQIGDLDFTYQSLERGDFYFIADPLCRFRKHSDSWTTSNLAKLATYLDWVLLAAKYEKYLPAAGLTPEQYCLNFVKSWVRDLECQLNAKRRLGYPEQEAVLRDLCGKVEPLSLFKPENRDDRLEFRALSAMALLQSSLLEHELRLVHDEIARPYTDTSEQPESMIEVRKDLAVALSSLKQTLRERDKEIASLRSTLQKMGDSVSWKVTEPLRKLKSGGAGLRKTEDEQRTKGQAEK
jgi:glycosyltransferase involved in cell wall biosynthesis